MCPANLGSGRQAWDLGPANVKSTWEAGYTGKVGNLCTRDLINMTTSVLPVVRHHPHTYRDSHRLGQRQRLLKALAASFQKMPSPTLPPSFTHRGGLLVLFHLCFFLASVSFKNQGTQTCKEAHEDAVLAPERSCHTRDAF